MPCSAPVGGADRKADGQRRTRTPSRFRVWLGRVLGVAVVVAIFGKALPHIVDLEEVATILQTRLTPGELILPGLLTLVSVLVSALGLRAALPGLRFGAACVVNVVTTALSYALPGGGAEGAVSRARSGAPVLSPVFGVHDGDRARRLMQDRSRHVAQ
ncbi:hypothetical protein ACGFNU_44490 [Spirillospora sp. NPDC048911]|uniref:hypothetical protein n=1 Tax=Spirillospora sp. NPDC048911 TaxID=3364527 RepID=UPI00371BA088